MRERRMALITFMLVTNIIMFHFVSHQALAAEPKGVMRIATHFGISADWLHPSLPPGDITRFMPLYFFHDALLKPMPDGVQSPCLAESWTISPDFKVYEFKLRKGVTFHNGDGMTAEDVVFSFQRYKGELSEVIQNRIDKLEAVNPLLFRVTFKTPFPNFLDMLIPGASSIAWVLPKKYIEKVGDNEFKRNPIGCGPYKFVEFKPGQRLVGEVFENFWRKKPGVKRIEFYFVDEAATRFAMLTKGEADLASAMTGVFYERIKKEPNVRVGGALSSNRWCMFVTSQWDPKSPWSDVRVRKAASLAVDRQGLIDIHFPGARPIGSIALPGDPEGVEFPPDPYDPKKAKQLLAEAGYPNGFPGGKYYPQAGGPNLALAEQVANYWRAVGITTETLPMDRPSFFAQRRGGKMQGGIMMEATVAGSIGSRLSEFFSNSKNYGSYPEIETLWDQYNKSVDPKVRKDLIGRIQKIMYDKAMLVTLCENRSPAAYGPRLKGSPYGIQGGYPIWYPTPMEDLELNE